MNSADLDFTGKKFCFLGCFDTLVESLLGAKAHRLGGSAGYFFLQEMVAQDIEPIIISTHKPKDIYTALEQANLSSFFDADTIFSAQAHAQPMATNKSISVIQEALKFFNVTPQDTFIIKGTLSGVRAAVAAGVPCYGTVISHNIKDKENIKNLMLLAGALDTFITWPEPKHLLHKVKPVKRNAALAGPRT